MKRSKKTPAPKPTKLAAKKGSAPKKRAAKDVPAAATTAPTVAVRGATPPRERDYRLPPVGTTITKEWRGKTLEVKCLTDGFEFDGKMHKSLSSAAKAASGFPSVNGYAFFALTPNAPSTERLADAKGKKPSTPSTPTDPNESATPAGQRAALAAAGIGKKRGSRKGKAPTGDAPAADATTTDAAAPEAK